MAVPFLDSPPRPDPVRASRALAQSLPPLLMNARHVAAMVAGNHGRRRPGAGDAFWQFRPAQAGDSSTLIDWRQSAKGQSLHVKETEAMAAHHGHLWVDPSPSMRWRSTPNLPFKQDRALLLGLSLGCLMLQAGERVAALGSPRPPLMGRHRLDQLAYELLNAPPTAPFPHLPKRRQMTVLISDFWQPIEEWQEYIRAVAEMGLTGHLIQVIDRAEESLSFTGRVQVTGLEDETPFLADRIEDLAPAYAARVAAHQAALSQLAQSVGWSFLCHHTHQSPATALLALFARLQAPPQWQG